MTEISEYFDQKIEEILDHKVWKLFNSGKVNPEYYAWYLWQQRFRYERLDDYAKELGIYNNWKNICNNRYMPNVAEMPATDFQKHLKEIFEDNEEDKTQILAAMYSVIVCDLVIGQHLTAILPGSNKTYKAEFDIKDLKNRIESELKNAETSMLDEVVGTFENTFYLLDVVWSWSKVNKN